LLLLNFVRGDQATLANSTGGDTDVNVARVSVIDRRPLSKPRETDSTPTRREAHNDMGQIISGLNSREADKEKHGLITCQNSRHSVGEIFLFRIATHVLKWKDRNRRLIRQSKCRTIQWAIDANGVDADLPRNVFEMLLADVADVERKLLVGSAGYS
jgi:hypothetical protein